MTLTRRELLTGIGGGALAIGGFSLRRNSPRFSQYTYAAPEDDTDDRRLRIAWYERYNGGFVANHAGTNDGLETTLDPDSGPAYVDEATFVTDTAGPVISVGNVLPGDAGTLVVGLEVVDGSGAEPLDVWFRASMTENAENGVNGPERNAGDTTANEGELDDEVLVEMWRDGSPLGSCNGVKEFDETLESPLVAPAPFADAFAPTADAGDAEGLLAFDCLPPGALRCVALRWELPETAGNRAQGDSLGFDFSFVGGACDGDSPFLVGGAQ